MVAKEDKIFSPVLTPSPASVTSVAPVAAVLWQSQSSLQWGTLQTLWKGDWSGPRCADGSTKIHWQIYKNLPADLPRPAWAGNWREGIGREGLNGMGLEERGGDEGSRELRSGQGWGQDRWQHMSNPDSPSGPDPSF